MSINRQEFTTVGRDMLGRANAGETLTISRVVVGSDRATAPADLWPLTELLNHVMDVTITQQVDQGNGILLIDAAFNSSQAPSAFELCELGVMAHIAAEPDRLYSVANVLATGADNVDPAVESIHAFKIKVVIDRAPNVTVVIGSSIDILAENIGAETVGPGWFSDKLANTLRFKRAVEGAGIELINGADTVTIRQKILQVDLDLYVPLTHPGGTPATRFATIQAALDYLDDISIQPERTARINVSRIGSPYVLTAPITVTHPQSNQIQIIGEIETPRNILSSTTAGVAGDYQISLVLDSGANIVPGDLVNITFVTGAVEVTLYKGVFLVTGVVGNTVTIQCLHPVAGLGDLAVTGSLTPLKTLIRPAAGMDGIQIDGAGLGLLQNFGFQNKPARNAIVCGIGTRVTLQDIGILSFSETGLYADTNSIVFPSNLFVADCTTGFWVTRGANLNITNGSASYCDTGLYLNHAYGFLTDFWVVSNNDIGFSINPAGVINAIAGFNLAYYNRGVGAFIAYHSLLISTVTAILNLISNGQDVRLSTLSSLEKTATVQWETANQPAGFSNVSGCYLCASDLRGEEAEPEQPIETEKPSQQPQK